MVAPRRYRRGQQAGDDAGQFAKLGEANKRIRLLEQANKVGQSLGYTSVIGDCKALPFPDSEVREQAKATLTKLPT